MAKNIPTDGVDTIINFNSSVSSYDMIKHAAAGECPYCHDYMNMRPPARAGDRVVGLCPNCGERVEYLTLVLSYKLAENFDVHNGYGQYGEGYVMHIYLPAEHPEFDRRVAQADPRAKLGSVRPAAYGDSQPAVQPISRPPDAFREMMKRQFPDTYKEMFGESDSE